MLVLDATTPSDDLRPGAQRAPGPADRSAHPRPRRPLAVTATSRGGWPPPRTGCMACAAGRPRGGPGARRAFWTGEAPAMAVGRPLTHHGGPATANGSQLRPPIAGALALLDGRATGASRWPRPPDRAERGAVVRTQEFAGSYGVIRLRPWLTTSWRHRRPIKRTLDAQHRPAGTVLAPRPANKPLCTRSGCRIQASGPAGTSVVTGGGTGTSRRPVLGGRGGTTGQRADVGLLGPVSRWLTFTGPPGRQQCPPAKAGPRTDLRRPRLNVDTASPGRRVRALAVVGGSTGDRRPSPAPPDR